MERDEKVQFILEQMRLCLATKDFIKTQIISKKISTKFFMNETDQVQVTMTCDSVIFMLVLAIGAQIEILQPDDRALPP